MILNDSESVRFSPYSESYLTKTFRLRTPYVRDASVGISLKSSPVKTMFVIAAGTALTACLPFTGAPELSTRDQVIDFGTIGSELTLSKNVSS